MFIKVQKKTLQDKSISFAFAACESFRDKTSGVPKHSAKFLATIRTRHLLHSFKRRVFWQKVESKILGFEPDERQYLRELISTKLAELVSATKII